MTAFLSLTLPLWLAGCSASQLDEGFRNIFKPSLTPQQYMLIAVSNEDPDQRRNAVIKVAESDVADAEWAIKGYVAIATLDTDPQARCVAIRALAKTNDPRAVETMLKLLNHRQHPARELRPPDDLCRWDAAAGLADLAVRAAVSETLVPLTRETFRRLLREDPERHVRLNAARGLQAFPTSDVVQSLIRGLRDRDFAVVAECEDSLVALTGRTFHCEPTAWQQWYDEHPDTLFARAGEIPAARQLPYDNRFEKFAWETREFFTWLWPGAKQER